MKIKLETGPTDTHKLWNKEDTGLGSIASSHTLKSHPVQQVKVTSYPSFKL